MSRAGETSRPDQKAGSGLAEPSRSSPSPTCFRRPALRTEEYKPDFPDLGSPVSPLRPCPANSSSSSSLQRDQPTQIRLPPLIFSVGSGCSGSSCTASNRSTNVLPTEC
ncbi:hypothetical protein OPV22_033760 [Ensete ventricosum]|nr:hypothetical protein OPV22_033760 [Ensete ventricosum]